MAGRGFASGHCAESTCSIEAACGAAAAANGGSTLPHACDSGPGQSGAPLLDAEGYVRLVHSAGVESFTAARPESNNVATLIDKFIFDNVVLWAAP
jgi:V8-like Glu-specific endopeptidase